MYSLDIDNLRTESFEEDKGLDNGTTLEMLQYMNQQDQTVPQIVAQVVPQVAQAVDLIVDKMRQGGRLIYMGAGSSGRLGVLDAAECAPTFGVEDGVVVGIIAGGDTALRRAVENMEDDHERGGRDVVELDITGKDSVVGLSASGRTPYVMGALEEAKRRGATTIAISNNLGSKIGIMSDVAIEADTGPEVLAGSTRLKAGTAQKLILNMISTGVMVRLGKVYRNLMIDMRATNEKLERRAIRIVAAACDCSDGEASDLLRQAGGDIKTAIVAYLLALDVSQARQRLERAGGLVRVALQPESETR